MSLRGLFRQTAYPIFQNRMYDSVEEARGCPRGDILLVENMETGLVYNAAFRPELVEYDASYQNEQALSPIFQSHLDYVADLVEETMGRRRLVEVGCGKGTFLELLLARGVDISGCDPTYEGDNARVARAYFSEELGITGDGLILRHVLEHIPDPVGFLARLAEANGNRGLIYLEVPCFDWICEHRSWFDIYYEHVNYFRLGDFNRMFGRVLHAGRAFNGQYLAVVADLTTLRVPIRDTGDAVAFPADFTAGLTGADMRGPGRADGRTVVWGGASKGVIFSLLRERAGHPVDRVVDINPAKQGCYLAATGLRVQSPEEGLTDLAAGSRILVMNPNYLDEIRAFGGPAFEYEVA